MSDEWQTQRLGDIAYLVRENIQPSQVKSLPYIGLEHIGEGSLQLLSYGAAAQAKSTKVLFKKGDILFGKLRPYFRKVIRAPFDGICSTDIWVIRPRKGIDNNFLFYFIASDSFIEPLIRASEGTKMPRANWNYAASLPVKLPPIPEQRAIAHILGTLDDKIELNRRMNETLEQMARAIFKAWFVDFEPVRAKMSGRWKKGESLPGLPAHLWDLFPDRLVPSKLGDIPEGWGIVRLGDVSDLNWGDTNVTKKSYVSNGYTAFSAKGPDGFLPYYDYDRTGVVLSAIGENFGLTWLAQGKWSCIKNTMRFWSIDESLPTEYLFYATCNKIFWPIRGSAQPFISQQDARNTLIMRPIGPLGKYFGNMVEPLHKKSFYVSTESKQLASLRDILLPRLISGKIHISTISNL